MYTFSRVKCIKMSFSKYRSPDFCPCKHGLSLGRVQVLYRVCVESSRVSHYDYDDETVAVSLTSTASHTGC